MHTIYRSHETAPRRAARARPRGAPIAREREDRARTSVDRTRRRFLSTRQAVIADALKKQIAWIHEMRIVAIFVVSNRGEKPNEP